MRDNFQRETAEILRTLSDYTMLMYGQVLRIFPEKSEAAEKIIARLAREKRVFYDESTGMVSYGYEQRGSADYGLIAAFWVLLEFFDGVEFHCPSEYPAQIAFFMGGKFYEIITVGDGKEAMLNRVLSAQTREQSEKIIIVGSEAQITKVTADNIFCFCTVGKTGEVEYFSLE